MLLLKSITAPTCLSRRTVDHGTHHCTIDASRAGGHLNLSQHLGFASNAHCLVVARDDTRFESKLVEESLFGLPKRANIDDSTLCSSVSQLLTRIDLNSRESGSTVAPAKGVDQLVHVHCLEEGMT